MPDAEKAVSVGGKGGGEDAAGQLQVLSGSAVWELAMPVPGREWNPGGEHVGWDMSLGLDMLPPGGIVPDTVEQCSMTLRLKG